MADRDEQQVEHADQDENALEDLEVTDDASAQVKGGTGFNFGEIKVTYKP